MAIMKADEATRTIPLFGARKMVRSLLAEVEALSAERDQLREQFARLGVLSVLQLESKRADLERELAEQTSRLQRERADAAQALRMLSATLDETRKAIIATEDLALLQEAGIYLYRH